MKNVLLWGLVALPLLALTGCGEQKTALPTNESVVDSGSNVEEDTLDVSNLQPMTPTVSSAGTYVAADGTSFSLVVVTNGDLSAANFELNGVSYALPQVESADGVLFADYGDAGNGISLALKGEEAIFTQGGVSTTYTVSAPAVEEVSGALAE